MTGIQKLARRCLRSNFDHKRTEKFCTTQMDELPPIMQEVLKRRFGIDHPTVNIDVICKELDLNRHRVRDLERAGIRRIRKAARL